MQIEMDGQTSTKKNSAEVSPHIKRRREAWSNLERHIEDAGRMLFGCYLATQLLPSSEPSFVS